MNNRDIEKEIQMKGKTAPRVTPAHIESLITSEHYFTAADGIAGLYAAKAQRYPDDASVPPALNLLTFCVLVLKNGFTVTGESACASPENFDAEIGQKIARQNAVNKIWLLEGYLLKQKLSNDQIRKQQAAYVNQALVEGYDSYYGIKDANWLSYDCLEIEYEMAQSYYEPGPDGIAPRRDLGE